MKIIRIAQDIQKIFDIANNFRIQMMDIDNQETMDEYGKVFLHNGKTISPPLCESASENLLEAYNDAGYKAEKICGKVNGSYHCWVELNGKVIVDFTVDQFSGKYPDVLIGTYDRYPEYEK